MTRILTPPKKTGVKKTTAKAAIGNAVVKAAKTGAREGAAEVAASRIARQTGASMAKSALGGSAFARQTGSSMVGGMKPKKTINTLKKRQISKPISESITTSPKIVDRRTGRDVTAKVTGQTSGRARKRRMVTR